MRLELTPGVRSGDGDLDKAGQLKNKYRKLRPTARQASQEHGLGYCNASLFPEQPQASLPQLVHPRKGSTIPVGQAGWRLLGPQGLPLILLQCPAPALPAGVGLGVAPGRAVQPQLLAPAETLGTGVHLHPRRLCKALEKGSAPRCRSPPSHGAAKHPSGQGHAHGQSLPWMKSHREAVAVPWVLCATHSYRPPSPGCTWLISRELFCSSRVLPSPGCATFPSQLQVRL